MPRTVSNGCIVVSALRARAGFGELLQQVEEERRSLVIEKRGTPRAVLLSIRDYVRLAAPEPEENRRRRARRPALRRFGLLDRGCGGTQRR